MSSKNQPAGKSPAEEESLKLEIRPAQGALQASKWLQLQMLISAEELRELFEELGPLYLVKNSAIAPMEELILTREQFLERYASYIAALMRGELPDLKSYRRSFTLIATEALDALFANRVEEERYLVKVARPIVQIQAHAIHYSKLEKKFRSMVFGPDSITWGLQFSYPQIYQDPETMRIEKANEEGGCRNAALFRSIQKWTRGATEPTPFVAEGERINVPMRLGKGCFSWINSHPQLRECKGIEVIDRR